MKQFIQYKQDQKEFNKMVKDIANLCAIPSISVESKDKKYPFGKEVNDALDYVLNLAKSFGFDTFKDKNNQYRYAQIGKGKKSIGILAHLDVVPEGDKSQWKTEAFKPVIEEDKIIARGSLDDKGPTIINLYAMKYIYDNKLLSDEWNIRIIFGLSEETTMNSMKAYLKENESPYLSYTPDGEWPLIFAEKTIYHTEISFPKIDNLEIEGGLVANQIPDIVNLVYKNKKETIKGIGGHGSTPEKGENAIIKAIKKLVNDDPTLITKDLFKFVLTNFMTNNYELKNIFSGFEDFSGKLSANLGIIKTLKDRYVTSFDLRVPVSLKKEDIQKYLNDYLQKTFKGRVTENLVGYKNSKYMPKDNEMLRVLMLTYNEAMKTNEEPLAIGGGTYARLLENCVAFGSTKYMHLMHGPNEYFSYQEIKDSLEIYINALVRLQDIK
ncbi:M20/M25/M40 family metallo-hydrolase [Mycoplasma struthionis]|uniref:M20 family peptidase n=1 Tax=Mycoplasma struthionis TaxID=538220 RepID=A0A3G8LHS3_9MOLU|nr:M20/M25/M40 family metallo-hydrolase [Mycoplasma struthionis]AZG68410.1 M20 family peptidase [Mycoplasma struthionis]